MNWLFKNSIENQKPETCSMKIFHLGRKELPVDVINLTRDEAQKQLSSEK